VLAIDEGLPLQSLLFLLVGWSFVASGWVAWARRPENHVGALMVVIGLVWFASQSLRRWTEPLPLTVGIWLGDLWLLPLAFLLAGFPLARLHSTLDRVLIGALAFVMIPLELLWLLFLNFESFGGAAGDNVLMVADEPAIADAVDTVQRVILIASLGTLATVLVRRWLRASAPLRRVLAPVLAGAAGLTMLTVVYLLDKLAIGPEFVFNVGLVVLSSVPIIFLVGILRARLARSAIGDLLVDLREPAEPGALRDALARALRDPTLELAYWVPEYEAYVGTDGDPVELMRDGRVTTFVERGDRRIAALIHDASLADEPQLIGAVTSAAGIALENERLQADLRARLSDLRASRSRIVEAGDAARRTLERDLHDGAQQRLVSISIVLRVVAGKLAAESPEARLLENARQELNASLEELRRIARGIHPAVLSDHGLAVALESLTARAPVKVALAVDLPERPPPPIEVAAYYLVAEGLTNVAKYAEADSAKIAIARENGSLIVELSDDGKGGADPGGGSGLRGLADRVEALDGRLRIWSPPGGGTRLRAEIPCV
jgi:signal transduction histidine kinase